jgi:hypothetical protein
MDELEMDQSENWPGCLKGVLYFLQIIGPCHT